MQAQRTVPESPEKIATWWWWWSGRNTEAQTAPLGWRGKKSISIDNFQNHPLETPHCRVRRHFGFGQRVYGNLWAFAKESDLIAIQTDLHTKSCFLIQILAFKNLVGKCTCSTTFPCCFHNILFCDRCNAPLRCFHKFRVLTFLHLEAAPQSSLSAWVLWGTNKTNDIP